MNHSPSEKAAPRRASRERQSAAESAGAQLGQRLLRLLSPLRLKSLSLHNAEGELVWLSRGEWTEIEQHYVREAGDAFAVGGSEPYFERALDDGRRALFFCARSTEGQREGLACAITDFPAAADAEPADPAVRDRVFATIRRFSVPQAPADASAEAALATPAIAPAPSPESAVAGPDMAVLEFDGAAEPQSEPAEPTPEPTSEPAASPTTLRMRPYARLRASGKTRRYEIAGDAATSLAEDLSRAQRLLEILQRRTSRGTPLPANFTLPLCAESVLAWDFLARLTPAIQNAKLAEGMLGFCLPAAAWERHSAATEHFLEQCATLGCFAVLDDFNLAGCGFALLRCGAVRALKLDAGLTATILTDKFSHASVIACVKAARVLGLYCIAKGVKSATTARWLGSAGIEYADRLSRVAAAGATTRNARVLAQAL
jgi:hypothetical protein